MPLDFVSSEQSCVIRQLAKEWRNDSKPLVTLQGSSGVGKRTLSEKISVQQGMQAVSVCIDPVIHDQFQTLLIDLAFSLECTGDNDLSHLIEQGELAEPVQGLLRLLAKKNLIVVVEDFDFALNKEGLVQSNQMSKFLGLAAKASGLKAKIILISNQRIDETGWATRALHFHLKGFQPQEACFYLEATLRKEQLTEKIPKHRLSEISARLAMNPRAINTFVYAGLVYENLDTLISLTPSLFEPGDVSMDSNLIKELEEAIFRRSLNRISEAHKKALDYISVYRMPISQEVYQNLPLEALHVGIERIRRDLQKLYFVENKIGDSLNPLLREICLTQLRGRQEEWERAHSLAADHQISKFRTSNKSTPYKLVGSFSELKHHLLESARLEELSKISLKFTKFICSQITKPQQSQTPSNRDVLEERICLISALPEEYISYGLFYHLALCLKERGLKGDIEKALEYAKKAQSKNIYYAYWLLRLDLEYELGGIEQTELAFNSYRQLRTGHGKEASIYLKYASIQKKDGQDRHAAETLVEGVNTVQPNSLTEIAPQCARSLDEIGETTKAITLLEKTIASPEVTRKANLYSACSKLLAKTHQFDRAKAMLRLAISDPSTTKIYKLQINYAELCCQQNLEQEAIGFLQNAITENHKEDPIELYKFCAQLLIKHRNFDEANELLHKGLKSGKIKDLSKIYIAISRNIERLSGQRESGEFLDSILHFEISDPSSIYKRCADIYFEQRNLVASKSVLERAIKDVNVLDKGTFYKDCADRHYRLGDAEKAISILREATDDPDCSNLYVLYLDGSKIYEKEGNLNDAIDFLKEGLNKAASRDNGAICLRYAELLYKNGEIESSINALKDAINEPGITRRWELYKACAEYLVKDKKTDEAIILLEMALEKVKTGNVAELYNLYAKTLISMEKLAEARLVLENALSLYSQNKSLHRALGQLELVESQGIVHSKKNSDDKNNTYAETIGKLGFFKRKMEKEDCYRIFYKGNSERDSGEKHAQAAFKLVWDGSPSTVNSEVDNGRGPVDFQITRGEKDTTLVEFKLASSSSLEQNVKNQTPIYAQANATEKYFTVIIFFTDKEKVKVENLMKNPDLDRERLFLIDARPKISASKVRSK